MRVWTAAEAKAKFSELMDKARTEGPQHVTKNGRDAVVVVSEQDWSARPAQTLGQIMKDPRYRLLSRKEMKVFERDRDPGRKIEF